MGDEGRIRFIILQIQTEPKGCSGRCPYRTALRPSQTRPYSKPLKDHRHPQVQAIRSATGGPSATILRAGRKGPAERLDQGWAASWDRHHHRLGLGEPPSPSRRGRGEGAGRSCGSGGPRGRSRSGQVKAIGADTTVYKINQRERRSPHRRGWSPTGRAGRCWR